jgi:aryl-alcohol dehydrogenase-like predicted oxidoreductase/HEAT repeat protein
VWSPGCAAVFLHARELTMIESSPGQSRPERAQPDARSEAQPGARADAQIDLLDPEGWRRRVAVSEIADADAGRYALRSALCFDPDASVRAAAATRLATLGAPAAWLREAAGDALPLVREAVIRGLGRLGDAEAAALLARACRTEPVWWVRRAAVLALAAVSGREAVPVLREVLDDPFWRVRYAAVQALAALGDEHDEVRAALASAPAHAPAEAAAIEYLRRHWREAARAPVPVATPAMRTDRADLWDDDPAVMTARLEDPRTQVSPAVLVELLADSHEPLRKLAVQRLREHGDLRAFEAAAIWLDEPRIPYAAETARALLDRLGDAARELVQQILEPCDAGEREAHGAGAVTWALGWIRATRCEELRPAVYQHLGAADARVRAGAVAALAALGLQDRDRDALARLLADPDADVRLHAVSALAAQEQLRALLDAVPYAAQAASVRRVLAAAAADDAARDVLTDAGRARLAAALDDPDAQARAHALAALDRLAELSAAERERARRDPDPWIRMAALDIAAALDALAGDPVVEVRRAALAWLVRHRRVLAAAERSQAAHLAAASPDAWQRTRAAALLDSGPEVHDTDLAALLRLSHDHQPMVRAAARDALEAWPDLPARIEALLAAPHARHDATLRKAGYTWLLRSFDAAAAGRLAQALAGHEAEDVLAHLRAMSAAFPAELTSALAIERPAPAPRPSRTARSPASRPAVARRPLGRTGLAIAPLAISGVNDLPPAALRQAHEAGVDLFFWEPHHVALTRFLRESPRRRHELAIATGTYHASPAAITADVDTALRRLRTDHLDIFLLFWVRSRARLSDDARACLERLKAAGKIRAAGFSTHHRDIACEAIATQPWDVIMTRHSTAHPGAEDAFLPQAAAAEVGVLTFSALCYGRLLEPSPDHPAPSAADCYRYSLSQPGVTACISAPQRYRELIENLTVLDAPVLAPAALAELRAHGRQVHARSRDFNELVRRFPAELPPSGAERLQALLDHAGREPRPLS